MSGSMMPRKLPRPRALIAEGDSITALHLQAMLKRHGYEVVGRVATGEDAVTLAEKTRPDVVIVDLNLKGAMDGIQAASAITARVRARIVHLSAYRSLSNDVYPAGSSAVYLSKPFTDETLAVVLKQLSRQQAA